MGLFELWILLVFDSLMKRGENKGRGKWETYNILAVNPSLGISYQLVLSFLLLIIFLYSAFQDPAQGLGNHNLAFFDDTITPSTCLAAFNYATAMSTSSVT